MKKITLITMLALGAGMTHAATLDLRTGYDNGMDKWFSRALIGHQWGSGVGGWLELTANQSSGSDEGYDSFTAGDNEAAVYYNYKLNDKLSLAPGIAQVWNSKGSETRPYVELRWKLSETVSVNPRYRYQQGHVEHAVNGNKENVKAHNYSIWATWEANDTVHFSLNPEYTKRVSGPVFNQFAGDDMFELGLQTRLVSVSKNFTPYFDIRYVDKGDKRGEEVKRTWLRVGVKIPL
ncbi:oligogalacturonate-specific porin KdgM family protein [Craterilacuibacter sp.]|uniref:oligogalacturonate-specific porin KdgM family protein n=1 Tax=Craterilacuibacter sp. TaxID=2870909 RepID=UPI003F401719